LYNVTTDNNILLWNAVIFGCVAKKHDCIF
jgi:hypothetical protein